MFVITDQKGEGMLHVKIVLKKCNVDSFGIKT